VGLGKLEECYNIVLAAESDTKWKQLGDLVLAAGNFKLAAECLNRAKDHSALLLLYSCQGDRAGMETLAKEASQAGRTNVAFVCNYLLGHTSECLNLLVETGRTPEAAFFARTYAPSQVSRMVELWKEDLTKVNAKAAESLADPAEYPNLFTDFDLGLIAEHQASQTKSQRLPAASYRQHSGSLVSNLIEQARSSGASVHDLPASARSAPGRTGADAAPANSGTEDGADKAAEAAAAAKAAADAKAKQEATTFLQVL
jgi:coatomer subunit beta'